MNERIFLLEHLEELVRQHVTCKTETAIAHLVTKLGRNPAYKPVNGALLELRSTVLTDEALSYGKIKAYARKEETTDAALIAPWSLKGS